MSRNIPPPPRQEALEVTDVATSSRSSEPSTMLRVSPPTSQPVSKQAQQTETKLTALLDERQVDKMADLKMQYYQTHRKWLGDSEFIRRLIDSASLDNILTPSRQRRKRS